MSVGPADTKTPDDHRLDSTPTLIRLSCCGAIGDHRDYG